MRERDLIALHERAERTTDVMTDVVNLLNAGLCNEELSDGCKNYSEVIPCNNRFIVLKADDGEEFLITITQCSVRGRSLINHI